jgi:atypical dual specificity phosphatase
MPPMDEAPLLAIEGLTFGFGDRVILKDVDFAVPRRGVFGIMGPAGVGKSTLLRTLARWSETLPNFWCKGTVHFGGQNLLREMTADEAHRSVPLLSQKARLYTATVIDNAVAELRREWRMSLVEKRQAAEDLLNELGLLERFRTRLHRPVLELTLGEQRMLSVARLVAAGAPCLLADEPLTGIPEAEAEELLRLLKHLGRERALVVVSHHQGKARQLFDQVGLFAGQRLVEVEPAENFFTCPTTDLAREYLSSGNCWPKDPEPEPTPEAAQRWSPPQGTNNLRPGGFHWVLTHRLGGAQRPGLLQEERQDLTGLEGLGCKVLVSLTQQAYDPKKLEPRGIEGVHFPIVDMQAPEPEPTAELCRRIEGWLGAGRPTVLHCRAGLGRTGTLLAAYLIHQGANAVHAIDEVRSVNPLYIQSQVQLDFLSAFEEYLS